MSTIMRYRVFRGGEYVKEGRTESDFDLDTTLLLLLSNDKDIKHEDIVYLDDYFFRVNITPRADSSRDDVSFSKLQAGGLEVYGLYGKAYRAEQAAATVSRKDREAMSERIAAEWREGKY